MSARPKLVQEGEPINGTKPGGNSGGGGGGGSSLMRAAKASGSTGGTFKPVPKKKPRPKSSTSSNLHVIGGGGQDTTATIGGGAPPQPSSKRVHQPSCTIGGDNSSSSMGGDNPVAMDVEPTQNTMPEKRNSSSSFHVVGGDAAPPNDGTNPTVYSRPRPRRSNHVKSSFVVGGGSSSGGSHTVEMDVGSAREEPIDRMVGIEDHSTKVPLVVLDGANVAYAYAEAMSTLDHVKHLYAGRSAKPEPDPQGIQVAANYFLDADLRVLVVLPASWYRSKPRPGDNNRGNAKMVTPQLEILSNLRSNGLLVEAPPTDDDDAYALTIAKREETRSKRRKGEGPGFVLSNDMFRDAMRRDSSGELKKWLNDGGREANGPGRISYAFCDMGNIDDYGDQVLDFVPNPRHPLVVWTEKQLSENDAI